jgi:hypothetical protein
LQARIRLFKRNIPVRTFADWNDKNLAFLEAFAPYISNLVVTTEYVFCWYWLADLCDEENLLFVLGHALYMKLIHGTKSKNDRSDSLKIAEKKPKVILESLS